MKHGLAALALLAAVSAHADDSAAVTATPGIDNVQRQLVEAGNYYFKPSHIKVQVGKPVELMIQLAPGIARHDFTIDAPEGELHVKQQLENDVTMVRFTPTKVGSYEFFCGNQFWVLKSHKEQGMHGVLEVVE